MKKLAAILLALLIFSGSAFAVDRTQSYLFHLTCEGKSSLTVQKGDRITVTFELVREGAGAYEIYAMQNEISFDDTLFEYVPDSLTTAEQIGTAKTQVVRTPSGDALIYMNFLATQRPVTWEKTKTVGTFQLRVAADKGCGVIRSTNCAVSVRDGTESFACRVSDLTVHIGDGSAIGEYTVAMQDSSLSVMGTVNGGTGGYVILAVYDSAGRLLDCRLSAPDDKGAFALSARSGAAACLFVTDKDHLPLCPGEKLITEVIP